MDNNKALRGLVSHKAHWDALEAYLRLQEDTIYRQLTVCSPEDLGTWQGKIAVIHDLLRLPESVQQR